MSLYLGTTEITKLQDLAPQSGLDITGLWFGETNVYTVWATYEGTLPATINANGDDMRQYQVYGATGGVGDRTVNWFDGYFEQGTTAGGVITESNNRVRSNIIAAVAGVFSVDFKNKENFDVAFDFWNSSVLVEATSWLNVKNYITPNNATSVRIKIRKSNDGPVTPAEVSDFGMYSGSTPPASYEPNGYKLDMSVKSGNLFDYRDYVAGYYISSSGVETQASQDPSAISVRLNHSGYIGILPDESYTMSAHHRYMTGPQTVAIAWYDESKIFISRDSTLIPKKEAGSYSFTATAPQNAKFAIFNFFTDDVQKVMFNPGTTPLDEYQPYSNTTTPIYIGDTPLEEDEYVDFGEQKIYRMINGTLQPTDPPVPLPALPTCEGETVVDYTGESVAPEKVLLKYRKEGF